MKKSRNNTEKTRTSLFSSHSDDYSLWLENSIRQLNNATLSEYTFPELYAYNPKYEEHEEAEQENISQHRQCVEQQHDQNAHTLTMMGMRGFRWQIDYANVILKVCSLIV